MARAGAGTRPKDGLALLVLWIGPCSAQRQGEVGRGDGQGRGIQLLTHACLREIRQAERGVGTVN